MATDKRRRGSSAGGSGGKLTGILAALLGGGGEATPNTEIDPEFAPEFEGAYLNKKGKVVEQPFSSDYNFWDRMSGRADQGSTLNAEVALNRILGQQDLQNKLKEFETLEPMRAKSAQEMKAFETNEALRQAEGMVPVNTKATQQGYWASKGVNPTAELEAAQAGDLMQRLQLSKISGDLQNSVLGDPSRQGLLRDAIFAKELAPLISMREGLETSVSPGQTIYRDAVGNESLDKLLNPGIYTGAMQQEKQAYFTDPKNGQKIPFGTTKESVPATFNSRIPLQPDKIKEALSSPSPVDNDYTVTSVDDILKAPGNQQQSAPQLQQPPLQNPFGPNVSWRDILDFILKSYPANKPF